MMKTFVYAILFCMGFLQAQELIEKPGFAQYYKANGVDGCFLLYDMQASKTYLYNKSRIDSGYIPASTFKILNSLIFLETGVLPDENYVVPWDSVKRRVDSWNKSQNLKEAFANSAVWIYQKYANMVGNEKMQAILTKCHFGNESTAGSDVFWLDGKLRITPREQMDFLIRFYREELPFSRRSFEIVKNIFIYRQTDSLVYRGKTGWAYVDNVDYGWWIGYITKGENVYFFVNFVENHDTNNDKFSASRKTIAEQIFKELGIVQAE